MCDFTGFPKENFRENMIKFWMENESVDRETAMGFYCDDKFDKLCELCDGTTLLSFSYDIGTDKKHCFEISDNNFVIPVNIIDIYKEEEQTTTGEIMKKYKIQGRDIFDKDRYITTIVPVPQVPVDNNNNIVVVYDKETKDCACYNKYKSSFKNKHSAIGILISRRFE